MNDVNTGDSTQSGVVLAQTETTRRINEMLAGDELHPAVAASFGNGIRFVSPRQARVVVSHRYGFPVIFTVDNREDRIHKNQLKGRFYEQQQLETIASVFPKGGTFMDVGANVGNHTLYMLLLAGAGRVLPVEPNPKAIKLLIANVMFNGLFDKVDFTTLGYGLDAQAGEGLAIHSPRNNLGWVKLKPAEEAEGDATAVPTRTGDSLVGESHVDFIKIDVEGMEVGALKGLEGTITRCKPYLFIELEHVNKEAAWDMLEAWGYEAVHEFEANNINQNILLKPKS